MKEVFSHLIFATEATGEIFLTPKISQSMVHQMYVYFTPSLVIVFYVVVMSEAGQVVRHMHND